MFIGCKELDSEVGRLVQVKIVLFSFCWLVRTFKYRMSSLLLREIVPTENKLKTDCKNDKWRKEIYKFVGGPENNKIINIRTNIYSNI